MRIARVRIKNFRSIRDLTIVLGDRTILIGQNNAGKTAILDAIRIVLTRRWGRRGTGFTENDVHRPDPDSNPRDLPPVEITLFFEEPTEGTWNQDMVDELNDIITPTEDGRRILIVQVIYAWNDEKEEFDPEWRFMNPNGEIMQGQQRATNLNIFFDYVPLFWLGPLRDASNEFLPRSNNWGNLLKSVQIPEVLVSTIMQTLAEIDEKIISADPRLSAIADNIGQATKIAIGQGPGAARLNTQPLGI